MKKIVYMITWCIAVTAGASAQIPFQPYQVNENLEKGVNVYAADVNMDGHIDLVTGSNISWYRNDSSGNFVYKLVDPDPLLIR